MEETLLPEVETSPDCDKLFEALAKAQGEITNAAKDKNNPHFSSKYADLASVLEACRAPLSKNGIAVIQAPFNADAGDIGVVTILGHSSGQWMRGRLQVKPVKPDAQGVGSVTTYLRRYLLSAMVGVAPDDDDGEGAVGRGNGGGKADFGQAAGAGRRAAPPPSKVAPQAAAPPHDTDGVVRPHQIAVPLKEGATDWIGWGRSFIAAVKAATTLPEIDSWWEANAAAIAQAEKSAAKAHQSVLGAVAQQRQKMSQATLDRVMSEEDANNVIPPAGEAA